MSLLLSVLALILGVICICILPNAEEGEFLCTTVSVVDINDNAASVDVVVPANSMITQIYASLQQDDLNPIDGGEIIIREPGPLGDTIFAHRFGKDPNIGSSGYETTLVQPLNVGPVDVEAKLTTTFGAGIQAAESLEITVVYCPAAE